MKDKTLKTLEYGKIISILKGFAVSENGKEIIEELRPISSMIRIKLLLDETDEGVRMLLGNGSIPLDGFYDLRHSLKKAKIGSQLSLREIMNIGTTLRVVKSIKKYCQEVKTIENFKRIYTLVESLDEFSDLEKEISKCIISEDELADGASPELFSIRRSINRKNQSIRDRLNSMISSVSYQKYLQEQLITIRQGRYVIPVKQEYRSNVAGMIHDQSSTGATLFIEPMAVVELNNDLRKLKLEEAVEIERIIYEFTEKIGFLYDELSNDYRTLVDLDVLFARAKYALSINALRPQIQERQGFNLVKARHPLIDPKLVVASDIYLGEGFNTLVITGPNTGGKTVVLKTVGLLCLMVQTGLFIPANERSSICIYEDIFADIGDEQSIEQSLSTFSSHMTNIVDIIKDLKDNSLVLLDELGAGTDPTEGAALAMAIIDYLRCKNVSTMVTTHYTELKQYAIAQDGVENASVEFDVKTLRPTYKLLIGIPGKSNAFEISKSLGLLDEIIENSKQYLSNENIKFEDILKDIENRRIESEENYQLSLKSKEVSDRLRDILEEEKAKLELTQKSSEIQAKEEALKIIEEANNYALQIIKEMKQIKSSEKSKATSDLEELKRQLKEKENTLVEEIKKDIPLKKKTKRDFKAGDKVHIQSLNQNGFVIKLKANNMALVEIGIMKTNVLVDDLVYIDEEVTQGKVYSTKGVQNKSRSIQTSIDVRGMTSEEVLLDIEKYIDNALLANLSQITIIHGKGTGVLRQTIQKFLKGNKHVSEYRLGGYSEGGTGATIVTLK